MSITGIMNTAAQALSAHSEALDSISDNVANASTIGYKTVETRFKDLVAGWQAGNSPVLGRGKQSGVAAYASFANRSQGQIVSDSNASSAAINGNGFFPVAKATGTNPSTGEPTGFEKTVYYTRQGDFQLDSSGHLVNSAGYYLMASGASGNSTPAIFTVDDSDNSVGGSFSSVSIDDGGAITAHYDDGNTSIQGQILLANFHEPDRLDRVDGTAFMVTSLSGDAVFGNPQTNSAGVGSIVGSALEESTADTADQMTKLIQAQQAYSLNSQVASIVSEMMTIAIDMKG